MAEFILYCDRINLFDGLVLCYLMAEFILYCDRINLFDGLVLCYLMAEFMINWCCRSV